MKLTALLFNKKFYRPFLVIILFSIVFISVLGEKVAYNDGAGWDGLEYRDIAKNFTERIQGESYDIYRLQRVLPFAIINVVYNAFDLPKDDSSLMIGANVLNILALILTVFIFFKISNHLRLNSSVEIIAFASIFFNTPTLKILGYYPFLSDYYAMCLGVLMFYMFLKNKRISLIITGIIGAFIWPIALVVSLCLCFFPRNSVNISEDKKYLGSKKWLLVFCKSMIIVAIPIFITLIFIYAAMNNKNIMDLYYDAKPLNIFMIIISTLAIMYYLYRVLKFVNFDVWETTKKFFCDFKWYNIFSFIVIYIGMSLLIKYISNGETGALDLTGLLVANIFFSTTDPFVFLTNHFLYFGFEILLIIFMWRQLLTLFGNYGYGFLAVIAISLFFSLRCESRVSIMFVPFIFFPLFSLINRLNLKNWVPYIYVIMSLVLSRFWYKINVDGIEEAFANQSVQGGYTLFPAQRYFMNFGHWQSHEMYLLLSIIGIVSAVTIILIHKKGIIYKNNK